MILTRENFEATLNSSMEKPLFCFFYQDAPECETAKNAVTTAISDTNEFVTLALCSLADETVLFLASRLQLMAVPTLVVIDKGQPVVMLEGGDNIVAQLSETLTKFIPNEAELTMRDALTEEANGNLSAACAKAAQAYAQDPSQAFKFIYARLLIALKNTAKAHELLDNPTREEQNASEYQQLLSALTLAEQAQNSPELAELMAAFENDSSDESACKLAVALAEAGRKEEALVLLFAKLKEDLSKEDVKKTFLDILSTMNGDKLQSTYRRKLYTLMY